MEINRSIMPIRRYCVANLHASGSNDSREIALVCFGDHAETAAILFAVKGTLALISAFCILLTLYVYWIIPDMRETQVNQMTELNLHPIAFKLFHITLF